MSALILMILGLQAWTPADRSTETPADDLRALASVGSLFVPITGDGMVEVRPDADGVHVTVEVMDVDGWGAPPSDDVRMRLLVPKDKLLVDVGGHHLRPSLSVPERDVAPDRVDEANRAGSSGEVRVGYLILDLEDASRVRSLVP